MLALEALVGGGIVTKLIREGNMFELAVAMQAGQAQGMQTLDQHLEQLVVAGTVTATDALERAQDRESFAQTLQRLKPDFELPEDMKA